MKDVKDDSIICQYCPCDCDGNCEHNTKTTGYSFIPDLDFCAQIFKEQKIELPWNTFLRAVFELHGNSLNKDWHRWLIKEKENKND